MGTKQNLKKKVGSYFLTITVVDWIKIFKSDKYFKIIIESFEYCCTKRGLNIYAYVIMPNHIHLVVNNEPNTTISDIIRDFKRYTSRTIVKQLEKDGETHILKILKRKAENHCKEFNFKVWMDGNHAIELYTPKFTWIKIRYIHKNPVKAGLVEKETDWKYSSATNYCDMDSVFDKVITLTPAWVTYD